MTYNLRNYGKNSFICLALLVVFVTTMKTASAQSTLSVYSFVLANLGSSISGTVKLVDETGAGAGARGTVVHGVWEKPDGSTFDQYANIGTRLRANFSLYTAGAPGKYTLTVIDATKTGYTFIPKNNSKSITIGGAGNKLPTAVFNADVISGGVPLTVNFDSSGSSDQDGSIISYAWNFGDDSTSNEVHPSHIYTVIGNYTATLTVTDDMGATDSQSTGITITDGNAGCISNCMSVDNITLSYKSKSRTMNALVEIMDENGIGVKGAEVHATWTLPDGSIVENYSSTGNKSRATFSLKTNVAGLYILTIVEVTKAGYSFDPDNSNVLTGTININP